MLNAANGEAPGQRVGKAVDCHVRLLRDCTTDEGYIPFDYLNRVVSATGLYIQAWHRLIGRLA